jgi:hypothetical protein
MQASVYQDLHAAIQERNATPQYGGGGAAASRIAEQKRTQDTRDNLKKATRVLLEVTKKQEDALKKHLQRAADPNEFRGMIYPYQLIPAEERMKINNAIQGYYSMKEKYNSALEKRRQRLMNDPVINWKTLSAQQKAKRLSLIRPTVSSKPCAEISLSHADFILKFIVANT